MDQNTVCNLGTYNRRVWCRAEVFSFYCRRGLEDMHIAVERDASYQLITVDEDQVCDTILVFEGDCACCARRHEGMSRCDKETLRDVIAGIYAAKLNEYTASGSATPCSQRSARPCISPAPAWTRRWSELWSPEPSLGVIVAVPFALLPLSIFVLLVLRYACETEIAVAVGEVEWTGDWPDFVGGAPGCGCTVLNQFIDSSMAARDATR